MRGCILCIFVLFAGCAKGQDAVGEAYRAAYQESDPSLAAQRLRAVVSAQFDCLGLDRAGYLEWFKAKAGSAYQADTTVVATRVGVELELRIHRRTRVPAADSGFAFAAAVESIEERRLSIGLDGRVSCDRTRSHRVTASGSASGVAPAAPVLDGLPEQVLSGARTPIHVAFPAFQEGVLGFGVLHVDWSPGEFPSDWEDAEAQHVLGNVPASTVDVDLPGPIEPGQDTATIAATWLIRAVETEPPIAFSSLALDVSYEEEQ